MPRTPRPWALLPAIVVLVALAAGCRRVPPTSAAVRPPDAPSAATAGAPADGLRARLELPATPAVGPVEVTVYLLDGSEGASGASVRVRAVAVDAPDDAPDDGSAVAAREVEAGRYQAERVPLSAPGRWRVTAEVRLPDGRTRTLERGVEVHAP